MPIEYNGQPVEKILWNGNEVMSTGLIKEEHYWYDRGTGSWTVSFSASDLKTFAISIAHIHGGGSATVQTLKSGTWSTLKSVSIGQGMGNISVLSVESVEKVRVNMSINTQDQSKNQSQVTLYYIN